MTQPPFPGNDFFDQIDSVARNLTGNAYRLKRDDPTAPQKFTEFIAQSEQEFNATQPQAAPQSFRDFEQGGFRQPQTAQPTQSVGVQHPDAQPSMGLLETFLTQHPLGRGALGALDVHARTIEEIAGGARYLGRILPDELPGGYEPIAVTQRQTEFDRVFDDARSRGLRLMDAFREARETVGFEQQHIPIGTEETGRHGVSGFLAALGNQIRGDLGQTNVDRNPLFEVGTTDLAIETLADPLFWVPGLGEAGPILKGTRAAVSGTKAGAGAALRQAGQSVEQAAAAMGRTGVGNVLDPVPPQTVAGRVEDVGAAKPKLIAFNKELTKRLETEPLQKFDDQFPRAREDRVSTKLGRELTPEVSTAQTGEPFDAVLFRGFGREDAGSVFNDLNIEGNVLGEGTYTTPSAIHAANFGDEIEELRVVLQNPLVIRTDTEWRQLTRDAGLRFPKGFEEGRAAQIRTHIEALGHDGVIVQTGDDLINDVFGTSDTVLDFSGVRPDVTAAARQADVAPVTKAPRVTLNNVNKELAARGHNAELVKGEGYFYFVGEDASGWYSSSVPVPRLTDDLHLDTPATVDNWVKEYERMAVDPRVNPDAAIEANRARYAPDVTPEQQAIIDDVGTGRPADTPNVARLREEGVINRNTENLQVNDARRVAQNHDLPTDPDLMQAAAQRAIERQGESVTAVDKIVEFLRAAKDAVQTSAAETSRLRRLGTRIGRRRARGISDPARAARAFRSGQAGQRRSREVFEPLIDPETRVFGMIPEEVSNLAPTEAAARIGITGDDLRSLYDAIAAKWPIGGNREWANHNAQVGLTKALLGDVPTDSELRLLREVFGKKIVKELVSRKPGRGRELLFDLVFLLAKTLRSSFDASAMLRQLVVFTVNPRRVKQSAPTFKRMLQVGFTKGDPQKLADQFNDELVNPAKNRHANRLLKLDVDPLDTTVPGGNKRIILHDVSETGAIEFTDKEEIYMSNISAMLPEFGSDVRKLKESRRKSLQRLGAAPTPVRLGIKAVTYPIRVVGRGIRRSELMFGTAINQMRMRVAGATLDNWDEAAREASRQGVPNPVEQESVDTLIDAVNVFTGRGNLPAFLTGRQGSRWLAAIFWAPKLAVSRFQAPLIGVRGLGELGLSGVARVTKASPDSLLSRVANSPGARARKEMAKDLVAFVTTGTTILAALKNFGVAEVETDPRSSDFGKGRIGNTRFDFWGGYQQPARYVWQAATGTQKRLSGENKGELVRLGAFNATKEEEAARAKRTGKPTPPPDRMNLLFRFIQSKIAPGIPALVVNELRGQTFVGDTLNEQAALFGEDTGPTVSVREREAIQQLLPLFGIDVVEAIEAQGFLLGVPLGGSAGLGVGVGTYDTEGEGLGRFDNVTTPAGGGDPWWYKR